MLRDADLEQVAQATAAGGFVNAGQVCISVQRVLVDREARTVRAARAYGKLREPVLRFVQWARATKVTSPS